jgi:protein HIRA/HIR1
MHLIKPQWLTHPGNLTFAHDAPSVISCKYEHGLTLHLHLGELKDFEVYSCHVSPDGSRLVTAAGGVFTHHCGADAQRAPAPEDVTD